MRFIGAYPIWNKIDMVWYLLEGIRDNCKPDEAEWWFIFDDCTDGGAEHFRRIAPELLKGYTYKMWEPPEEVYEMGSHNWFIDEFQKHKAEALVVYQDDCRIAGSTLFSDLGRCLDHYGERVGYIGCRDGYNAGLKQFISSPWVKSDMARPGSPRVKVGEWAERVSINPGPLIYTKNTVTKVGKLNDQDYKGWYWWDEYALRCKQAGLQNLLLGTEIEHRKFGRVKASKLYLDKDGWVAQDAKTLADKWSHAW
jgi:hypothetical protein